MNVGVKKMFTSQPIHNNVITKMRTLILMVILIITLVLAVRLLPDWIKGLTNNNQLAPNTAYQANDIYLPLAMNETSQKSVFGVELQNYDVLRGLPLIEETNTSWLRYNALIWSAVEETEGGRDWTKLGDFEKRVMSAYEDGLQIIMIVRSAPSWAQQVPGAFCGPIKREKLSAFGDFLYDAVSRYGKYIKYWEIWNEPDVAPVPAFYNDPWGCWGDPSDPYYGGAYYADMLKAVYPRIKQADPTAQVVLGGLLLDCDPRPNSNWCDYWKHLDEPPKFLEGILLNGGGSYFDGVSFHGYDYFDYTDPQFGEYLNPVWGNSWNGEPTKGIPLNRVGPVSKYKAEYIREILQKYQIQDKFLMNTESALLCGATSDPPGGVNCEPDDNSLYEQTKARYLPQAYVVALAEGLEGNFWFSLFGWRNSGLLNEDQTPRPAFNAYKVLSHELAGASFLREVSDYTDVKIYEFQLSNRNIWVIWSVDGNSHTITLPFTPVEVKDFMGVVKTPGSTFTATLDPHYIIWNP